MFMWSWPVEAPPRGPVSSTDTLKRRMRINNEWLQKTNKGNHFHQDFLPCRKLESVNRSSGKVARRLPAFDLRHTCRNRFPSLRSRFACNLHRNMSPCTLWARGTMEAQRQPMKWNYHLLLPIALLRDKRHSACLKLHFLTRLRKRAIVARHSEFLTLQRESH